MKKVFFLALSAIMATSAMAQSTKIMKVWKQGKLVEQSATNRVDSITFATSDDKLTYATDIYTITGKGDALKFDTIFAGVFHIGDAVRIIPLCDSIPVITDTIKNIEGLHTSYESTDLIPDSIHSGMFILSAGSIKNIVENGAAIVAAENCPYEKAHKLICDAYWYTKEEGGRKQPVMANYRTALRTETNPISIFSITNLGLVNGDTVEMIMPGSTAENMVIESSQKTAGGATYGFVPYKGQTLYFYENSKRVAKLTVKDWE